MTLACPRHPETHMRLLRTVITKWAGWVIVCQDNVSEIANLVSMDVVPWTSLDSVSLVAFGTSEAGGGLSSSWWPMNTLPYCVMSMRAQRNARRLPLLYDQEPCCKCFAQWGAGLRPRFLP